MYIVKQYTVAQARAAISSILDSVENGEVVIIRRRTSSFRVIHEPKKNKQPKSKSVLKWVDPMLLKDNWHWEWTAEGVMLRERPRKP